MQKSFIIEIFSACLEQSENSFNDLITVAFGKDTKNIINLFLENESEKLHQRLPNIPKEFILDIIELYKFLDMTWGCFERSIEDDEEILESFRMLTMLSCMIGEYHSNLYHIIKSDSKEEFSKKGNKARAKKFEDIKKTVQEDFKNSRYTSYAKFAENEFFKYKVSYRTILGYLYELS